LQEGIITAENVEALMISYSEIGGHVLTPFLDTYPGSVEVKIGKIGQQQLVCRKVADEGGCR